tara:strand:+ start:212 stop:418 length:207 start_codon:yes stop_codon:yes gene_type:complete
MTYGLKEVDTYFGETLHQVGYAPERERLKVRDKLTQRFDQLPEIIQGRVAEDYLARLDEVKDILEGKF